MPTSFDRVIVFAKDRPGLTKLMSLLSLNAKDVTLFTGDWGDPIPYISSDIEIDLIVSYLSPWIIPAKVLTRANRWAINFHPGSPEYPGIGCTNFALYRADAEFAVTAHHMEPQVDRGEIIAVEKFPIDTCDDVSSLTNKCYQHLEALAEFVLETAASTGALPKSELKWMRQPYTRKELNALCRIEPSMEEEEIKRRVRATYFPGKPGPYIELRGYRFELTGSSEC